MKKILIFGGEKEDVAVLRKTALTFEIVTVDAGGLSSEMTVRDAFETEEDIPGEAEVYENGYLVMEGMSVEDLTALLRKVREAGAECESIKVMRTETNQNWTLGELFAHTAQEHRIVTKARILSQVLKSTNSIDMNALEEKEREDLKNAMMAAWFLLQQGEYTADSLDAASADLMTALKNAHRRIS